MRTSRFLALAVLTSTLLTGCATSGESDTSSIVSPDMGYTDMASKGMPGAGVASDGAGYSQSVITTAWVSLIADAPETAATEIEKRTSAINGHIDARTVSTDVEGVVNAVSLTVRVPSAELDGFLSTIGEVARVQTLSQNATDVTLTVTDYTARIASLQSSIARLSAMQDKATTTKDLIDIESALADRQTQLEQLQGEMRYYQDQIDLSTIQVDIGLPESATNPVPDDFWGGIVAGWRAIGVFFGGIIVGIGMVIPWLPLAAVAWFAVRWVLRRRARGSKATAATKPKTSAKTARKG